MIQGEDKENKTKDGMIEDIVERRMRWFYMKYHATDLIVLGRIPQRELNYENIVDLEFRGILNIYCSKGNNFNTKFVKDELRELGLDAITATKLVLVLDELRMKLPNDISDEEMASDSINRELPPCVCGKHGLLSAYRETYRSPETVVNKKRKVEDLTQLTESTDETLFDVPTQKTTLSEISTQSPPSVVQPTDALSQDSDLSSLIVRGISSKTKYHKK